MASFDDIIGSISSTSGAIGGIASLFGSLFGGDQAKKTYKYQKKLAAYQSQLQMQNWQQQFDAQNEYNTPLAQRQRLTTAGYNPNLLYGLGSVGNSSMAAAASAPSGQLSESFGDSRAKQMQGIAALEQSFIANREAESRIQLNKSAADNQEAQAEEARGRNKRENEQQQFIIANYKAMTALYSAQKELVDIDKKTREQLNQKQIEELDKKIAIMAEQIVDMQRTRELREREFEHRVSIDKENLRISWANVAAQKTNAAANMLNAKSNAAMVAASIPVQKELANYYRQLADNTKVQISINKETYKALHNQNLLNYDSKFGYTLKIKGVKYEQAKKWFSRINPNLVGFLKKGSQGGAFLCLNNAQIAMMTDRQMADLDLYLQQYNKVVAEFNIRHAPTDKALEQLSAITHSIGALLGGSGVYQSSQKPQIQGTTVTRNKNVTHTQYHY